jgi:hypothetical protein
LENTPRLHPISTAPEQRRKSTHNTTQNLRNLQIDHALSCEEDSSETDDEHETCHDRVSISESLGNVTIDEKTNDFAHVGAVAQPRLPPCRNLVLPTRQLHAILLIELFKAIYFSLALLLPLLTPSYSLVTQVLTKVTQQTNIIPLHGNTSTDQQTPAHGLGIQLNPLPQRHPVLFISCRFRIVDYFVHGLCVREVVLLREVEGSSRSSGFLADRILPVGSHLGFSLSQGM